jgi:hypothetical protein
MIKPKLPSTYDAAPKSYHSDRNPREATCN